MVDSVLDRDLKPFIINEQLREAKKDPKSAASLAAGSYGFVYEVKVGEMLCVAKKPHTLLCEGVNEDEKRLVIEKFKRECLVLSKLRHPNIVPFLGIYYGSKSKEDIAMVMLKMECDLADFLEKPSKINDSMKISILKDVSYGLVYLHECHPQIIHRDLTARNILLTKGAQAKIADVGVSKLMDEAAFAVNKHTTAPGNWHYMPPEALMEDAEYNFKLDIFSFGHLCLHVLIEDFPEVFEVKITSSMIEQGIVQKTRRKKSIDKVTPDHPLLPLIFQCLNDYPERRPTTRLLNSSIIMQDKAEVFMNDFEEEKKFERQIAELKQEIAEQKGMVNTQKIQIAQMTAEMKSKSQTSKELMRGMKKKVEEQSRDIDCYKKKANRVPKLDSELQKYKKVLKDVTSKLDQKVMDLSQLKKEAMKSKDQVNRVTATQVAYANALERTNEKLANVKLEYQDLKKAHQKLENQFKKKERTKKISKHLLSASVEEPDESLLENFYDVEVERNLELTGEIDHLKNRIEDLSMEIQEYRKLLHEFVIYKVEDYKEPPTHADTPSSSHQHKTRSSYQIETRSKRLTARNTTQLDHNYEQLPGHEDQDKTNDICSMPGMDKPPIPPRDNNCKIKTDFVSDQDHERKNKGAHEGLHDRRLSTQSETIELGFMEASATNKECIIRSMSMNHSQKRMSRGHNIVKNTENHNVSGNHGASGNQGVSGNQDGSHISYPSLDTETFLHQGDNTYHANPCFQSDFEVPSRDQVQESQHFVNTDPRGIYQRRDEHRAENQAPSAPARMESDQYIPASDCISSVGDPNSQSQLNPKLQPSSKERISHTSSSDDEETVPYDPNLVCPICGKKFRFGKIQIFRKHVNACV